MRSIVKALKVGVHVILDRMLMMDVVVVDCPTKWGMLWYKKMGFSCRK